MRLFMSLAVWILALQPCLADELLGTVKSVKTPNLIVTDQRNKERAFLLTPTTKIHLPDKQGAVADLKTGYRVRVRFELAKGAATALEITVQGLSLRIAEIETKTGTLVLMDKQGKKFQLPIGSESTIRLDGQKKKLADLRPGDMCQVVIDDREPTKTAMHVEAQSGKPSLAGARPDEPATPVEEDKFVKIKVFYGTDRNPVDASKPQPPVAAATGLGPLFGWVALIAGGVMILFVVIGLFWWIFRYFATFTLAVVILMGLGWYLNIPDAPPSPEKRERVGMWYGSDRGKVVAYGFCDVSIPKSHKHADLEGPNLLRGEHKEDPAKHIMLHDAKELELVDFVAKVREQIKKSSKEDAFVFIHGYNVSFEDAARRTGQLAYDLKFAGAPLFYSWPAQGLFSQYTVDEANAEWAMPHLQEFLKNVAAKTEAKVIHLIAHSMGNRVLTRALHAMAQEDGKNAPRFHEVILAAPDVDADVFRTQIYPAIVDSSRRMTLYASSRDRALQLSKQVHGFPRLGESGEDLVVLPKVDSIDVSNVDTSIDGHTYYGDNSSVVSDIFHLLQNGLPPEKRDRLRPVTRRDLKYWFFVP
jgi:esterase/lipase superfamily enzyme